MRKIGPRNSRQEVYIRNLVKKLKYKFRLHQNNLPGKPDISFPKYKKVIFINGCFWHGHKRCPRAALPKTNNKFWENKIRLNVQKDRRDYRELTTVGWKYLTIWQCSIKAKNEQLLINRIKAFLKRDKKFI